MESFPLAELVARIFHAVRGETAEQSRRLAQRRPRSRDHAAMTDAIFMLVVLGMLAIAAVVDADDVLGWFQRVFRDMAL
jgi:hypothetical protein